MCGGNKGLGKANSGLRILRLSVAVDQPHNEAMSARVSVFLVMLETDFRIGLTFSALQ